MLRLQVCGHLKQLTTRTVGAVGAASQSSLARQQMTELLNFSSGDGIWPLAPLHAEGQSCEQLPWPDSHAAACMCESALASACRHGRMTGSRGIATLLQAPSSCWACAVVGRGMQARQPELLANQLSLSISFTKPPPLSGSSVWPPGHAAMLQPANAAAPVQMQWAARGHVRHAKWLVWSGERPGLG